MTLGDLVFAPGANGVAIAEDVLASLRRLEENLNRFKRAQEDFTVCFNKAMAPCRIPSKLRQRCVDTGEDEARRSLRRVADSAPVALRDDGVDTGGCR